MQPPRGRCGGGAAAGGRGGGADGTAGADCARASFGRALVTRAALVGAAAATELLDEAGLRAGVAALGGGGREARLRDGEVLDATLAVSSSSDDMEYSGSLPERDLPIDLRDLLREDVTRHRSTCMLTTFAGMSLPQICPAHSPRQRGAFSRHAPSPTHRT